MQADPQSAIKLMQIKVAKEVSQDKQRELLDTLRTGVSPSEGV